MGKNINLLEGPIFPSLSKLALPIMATSFVQMAYNLIDMLWIGKVGSSAVAAVGTAGMYPWFANGFASIARMGGQVKTGHALGAKREEEAIKLIESSLQLGSIMGVAYGVIAALFASPLIGFFNLNHVKVIADAEIYMRLTGMGVVFSFVNTILSGIVTVMGNSRTAFRATAIGLISNIIMDPLLIFGVGIFPRMRVAGAAIATVCAQVLVTVVFIISIYREEGLFHQINLLKIPDKEYMAGIIRLGIPTGMQTMVSAGISMVIARMIAGFGDDAVAVQKIGVQIESISWMTAEGFGTAVNAFMAQNLGAGNRQRIIKGCRTIIVISLIWGCLCTFVLMSFPSMIFRIFISDQDVLNIGERYLWILGISQLFMCMELTIAGAFAGLGKTRPPSVSSGIFTSIRIPLAYVLMSTPLQLDGIWWSLTISGVLKGIILVAWFAFYFTQTFLSKRKKTDP